MKKTLAILLSAVMMLGLLAGCGSKTTEQPSTSGTENTETAALNVGVFYYDYSDVYISSVRSSMDEQLKAMGVNYTNYDGAGNQAQQTDQINTAISNGANSMMFDIIHGNLNDINAKVVFDAAKAGDSLANTIVNQVTVYLGIAISNVINLLDPQLIILGGGVSQAGDFLLNPLLDEVSRHVLPVKEPHIVISSLGEDAVAIGAATFLLKEYVESGKVQ